MASARILNLQSPSVHCSPDKVLNSPPWRLPSPIPPSLRPSPPYLNPLERSDTADASPPEIICLNDRLGGAGPPLPLGCSLHLGDKVTSYRGSKAMSYNSSRRIIPGSWLRDWNSRPTLFQPYGIINFVYCGRACHLKTVPPWHAALPSICQRLLVEVAPDVNSQRQTVGLLDAAVSYKMTFIHMYLSSMDPREEEGGRKGGRERGRGGCECFGSVHSLRFYEFLALKPILSLTWEEEEVCSASNISMATVAGFSRPFDRPLPSRTCFDVSVWDGRYRDSIRQQ
ncbi:unnamed protein product [Pleuronectes platessa]|uniref:Uncharacterized protein n=1 Tax=Pleuronectes platessa TaxID=8262 RepID=A0A9N7YJM3_PLEPL|nr:unnamed protein product [Pleuronectes platessa]